MSEVKPQAEQTSGAQAQTGGESRPEKPVPVAVLTPRLDLTVTHHILAMLTRLFFRLYGRGRVVGLENVPRKGALIFAANHASNLDPFLAWAILRPCRRMWGVAKVELWDNPASAYIMQSVGALPVRRGTADRVLIRTVLELLAKGEVVGLFPEGTRTPDGALQPPQAGIGLLAQKSGASVIPVGLSGTYAMLPTGQKRLKRARLTVVIGKPMTFAPDATREQIAAQIMQEIGKLLVACCVLFVVR